MGKKIKQEKGITVVALVITIIVLLILAAISIATLTGENGILTKARKAKEETKIAEYKEALELIGIGLQQEKVMGKLSSEEYMKNYANKIENDDKFKDSNVILNTEKNPITIQVITKEGYVYLITEDKVEVMGKEGETAPPDLQESDVTFTYEPTDWTNGSVEVKIETEITGYTLQYSTDGTKWTNYTEKVTKKDNGVIYARLINNLDEVGGYATGNVENIDRLVPNSFTPTATSTTNSITLTGSTTDAEKTEIDGCSGINKYYFSKDNGSTWEPSGGQTGTNYTFTGLTQNKSYSLKMKAVDKAGNETITSTVSKSTEGVPGLTESNTTFTYSPSTPTNGNVAVTITTTAGSEYTLQYSTDGTTWKDYTTAITMTQNGEIYARVKDSTGQVGGTATGNVENIDKLAPNNFTPTATVTASSITLTGSTTDQAKTATNASSGIKGYYFSKDNGATWLPTGGQTTTSYTFSGLTSGTTYSLKMKAVDNAGNEVITATISKMTTKTISNLTVGEYVNYIDKNGTTIKCIVLYDTNYNTTNGTDYGVQIITADTVEDVELGNGTGSTQTNNATYFNTARNSYNNAISTLNTRANAYLNTTYASSARCVGSVPDNPSSEASGYFTADSSYTYMSSYNGTFKNTDTNYTSDWNQMKALNIHNIGEEYWLSSRNVYSNSSSSFFSVCYAFSNGSLYNGNLCVVYSSGSTSDNGFSNGFRPVFALKSGIVITGGAGTADSPYTLN